MPDATPVYGLPYPNDTDTLKAALKDVPKSLAEQVESTIGALTGTPAPTAWTVPAFGSGWSSGTVPPRYRKVNGVVYVSGTFNKATWSSGDTVMTFPVGFRPSVTVAWTGFLGHTGKILTTGVMTVESAPSGGGFWLGLTSFPL